MATSDFSQPMRGDLLWVYEGLTAYLQEVLAARSGLVSYPEFLEADALIRQKSHGKHSLDDFCLEFFSGPHSAPIVAAYDFDDVVAALNRVQPYDWREFWTARLSRLREEAPLEGLRASGW